MYDEYFTASDACTLNLDSFSDSDIIINNSESDPASTIYLHLQCNRNLIASESSSIYWSGDLNLKGPASNLVIIVNQDIEINGNNFHNVNKVVVCGPELLNHNNKLDDPLKLYQVSFISCAINHLYLLNHHFKLTQTNIENELVGIFANNTTNIGSLEIRGGINTPCLIGSMILPEDHKPATLLLNNVKIKQAFNIPEIESLSVVKFDAEFTSNILSIKCNELVNFADFQNSDILHFSIIGDRISFSPFKLPRGKIYIAPQSFISIKYDSMGDFEGIGLVMDLRGILEEENRVIKFPKTNIKFDSVVIINASLIESCGSVVSKSIEIKNCPKVYFDNINSHILKYSTDIDGEIIFGFATASSSTDIETIVLKGKININFAGKTKMRDGLYSFGQSNVFINNTFTAEKMMLNIDTPPPPSSNRNSSEWDLMYNRNETYGIAIYNNNGSSEQVVYIKNLCGQFTKFIINSRAQIDEAIWVPASTENNYFHVDPSCISFFKIFMASFYGDLMMYPNQGDIIFTYQTSRSIATGFASTRFINIKKGYSLNYQEDGSYVQKLYTYNSLMQDYQSLRSEDLFGADSLQKPDNTEVVIYKNFFNSENLANELLAEFIDTSISKPSNGPNIKIVVATSANSDLTESDTLQSHNYLNQLYLYLDLAKKLYIYQYPHLIFFSNVQDNQYIAGIKISNLENDEFYIIGLIAMGVKPTSLSSLDAEICNGSKEDLQNSIFAAQNRTLIIDQNTGLIISKNLDPQNDEVIILKKQGSGFNQKISIETISLSIYNMIVCSTKFSQSKIHTISEKLFAGFIDFEDKEIERNCLALTRLLIDNMSIESVFLPSNIGIFHINLLNFRILSKWIMSDIDIGLAYLINQDIVRDKFELLLFSNAINIYSNNESIEFYNFHDNQNSPHQQHSNFYSKVKHVLFSKNNNKILLCIESSQEQINNRGIINHNYIYLINEDLILNPSGNNLLLRESLTLVSSNGVYKLPIKLFNKFLELESYYSNLDKASIINMLISRFKDGQINIPQSQMIEGFIALSIISGIDQISQIKSELNKIYSSISEDMSNVIGSYILSSKVNQITEEPIVHAKILHITPEREYLPRLSSTYTLLINATTTNNLSDFIREFNPVDFDSQNPNNIVINPSLCIKIYGAGNAITIYTKDNNLAINTAPAIQTLISNTSLFPFLIYYFNGFFYASTETGLEIIPGAEHKKKIYLYIPDNYKLLHVPSSDKNLIIISASNTQIEFNLNDGSNAISSIIPSIIPDSLDKNFIILTKQDTLKQISQLHQETQESEMLIIKPFQLLKRANNENSKEVKQQEFEDFIHLIINDRSKINYQYLTDVIEAILELGTSIKFSLKGDLKYKIIDACRALAYADENKGFMIKRGSTINRHPAQISVHSSEIIIPELYANNSQDLNTTNNATIQNYDKFELSIKNIHGKLDIDSTGDLKIAINSNTKNLDINFTIQALKSHRAEGFDIINDQIVAKFISQTITANTPCGTFVNKQEITNSIGNELYNLILSENFNLFAKLILTSIQKPTINNMMISYAHKLIRVLLEIGIEPIIKNLLEEESDFAINKDPQEILYNIILSKYFQDSLNSQENIGSIFASMNNTLKDSIIDTLKLNDPNIAKVIKDSSKPDDINSIYKMAYKAILRDSLSDTKLSKLLDLICNNDTRIDSLQHFVDWFRSIIASNKKSEIFAPRMQNPEILKFLAKMELLYDQTNAI